MRQTECRQHNSDHSGYAGEKASCSVLHHARMKLRFGWLMAWILFVMFPCGGATCARRRPMELFTPPVVFDQSPTLAQLIEQLNRTRAIERMNCGMLTLSSAEVSTELSGNLSWHRPSEFRMQAYPGATRMLGDALDAGSNSEAFWLLMKIPGERHTLYRARHDQFEMQTGPRRILPVSPLWIREALGVIEFDPAGQHDGPLVRPDGKLEIRSMIPTPRGTYERTVIVEPTRATIQQLLLKDPEGKMVAHAQQSEHQYYSAIDASLPHRVDLQLQANDGPVLAFTLRIGSYTLNEVVGNEALRYVMPDPSGLAVVDLVQANSTLGQNQPISVSLPNRTAQVQNPLGNYR
jgi:hypothetical protein